MDIARVIGTIVATSKDRRMEGCKICIIQPLDHELKRCHRYGLPLAVLMMDLDFFKSINDTNGHLMGSHVLSEVGRLIRESIRVADISARYGGEEFGMDRRSTSSWRAPTRRSASISTTTCSLMPA